MKTITYNPETHVLVPREPTAEMVEAGIRGIANAPDLDGIVTQFTSVAYESYRAMIAAAPQPEPVEVEPIAEHELQDTRCECCGYMTYHREHIGCIRSSTPQPDRTASHGEDGKWAYEEIVKLRAELAALKAENASLRQDAERWRFLRKTMEESVGGGVLVNDEKLVYEDPEAGEAVSIYWYPDTPVGFYESKADTLDEAIDAMAQGEKR